jgi:hypothetical protein
MCDLNHHVFVSAENTNKNIYENILVFTKIGKTGPVRFCRFAKNRMVRFQFF